MFDLIQGASDFDFDFDFLVLEPCSGQEVQYVCWVSLLEWGGRAMGELMDDWKNE